MSLSTGNRLPIGEDGEEGDWNDHRRLSATRREQEGYALPIAAILSVIGSLACCLPLAFLAAFGAVTASAIFTALRPWLLILSAALLVTGFLQLYRGGRSCQRRDVVSVAIFWIAVAIFLTMMFFSQQIASLLAGRLAS